MSEKKQKHLTPVGEAKWAHVHTPKAAFTNEQGRTQGDPKYMIDVVFSPDDPAWKDWASKLKAQIDALPVQVDKKTGEPMKKQMPIKRELDQQDQPTGRFCVSFKTGEQFAPGVFDRFNQVIPKNVLIGNGSKVRVNYNPVEYTGFGGGIALYLNAVQVVELVEYGNRTADAYGFTADEKPAESDPGSPPPKAEDDLPF